MKTPNIALLILTGAVLLGVGYMAGTLPSRSPQPQGNSPDTIIKEWRGSARGRIAAISETSITIEKGGRVIIGITPETEISKSIIDEEGVEQLTPITLQELQVGDEVNVAVVLAEGRLRAAAIRVLEEPQR